MSEIERAAREWAKLSYADCTCGKPDGYGPCPCDTCNAIEDAEEELRRAIGSTPPEPPVTLTVEEAGHLETAAWSISAGYHEWQPGYALYRDLAEKLRDRIAKAREAGS